MDGSTDSEVSVVVEVFDGSYSESESYDEDEAVGVSGASSKVGKCLSVGGSRGVSCPGRLA